jgi:hypothetical protein
MLDIVYLVIALFLFLVCWALLILCERLMEE